MLAMEKLDRLHQGGCARLGQAESLALGHRKRARIGTYSAGDGNPDTIEPRHIAETGNADLARLGFDARQRVIRRGGPVGSALERLGNRPVETTGQSGEMSGRRG